MLSVDITHSKSFRKITNPMAGFMKFPDLRNYFIGKFRISRILSASFFEGVYCVNVVFFNRNPFEILRIIVGFVPILMVHYGIFVGARAYERRSNKIMSEPVNSSFHKTKCVSLVSIFIYSRLKNISWSCVRSFFESFHSPQRTNRIVGIKLNNWYPCFHNLDYIGGLLTCQ